MIFQSESIHHVSLLLARGHHCPHGAHRLCCLRPLLWPRNLASEELLLLLRVRTAIAMIMEEATTTSKQRKSNFLNPKGFPKKVLKDSLRTFQKEKIFALLLLTGLLKAPNSPLFPPGEYAKRCYIEPQQQPQLATLEAYGSLTQKPRP